MSRPRLIKPNPNMYYSDSRSFPAQGESDQNRLRFPYRQPIFAPGGGIPERQAGIDGHDIVHTSQVFTIPAGDVSYAIDSSSNDDNGDTADIILATITPGQGRYRLIPNWYSIAIQSPENAKAQVNLDFISLTSVIRRISDGEIIWAQSSNAPAVRQFYAGISVQLPILESDFYTYIDRDTDVFENLSLSYSAVFANHAVGNLAAKIYSTLSYDCIRLE